MRKERVPLANFMGHEVKLVQQFNNHDKTHFYSGTSCYIHGSEKLQTFKKVWLADLKACGT